MIGFAVRQFAIWAAIGLAVYIIFGTRLVSLIVPPPKAEQQSDAADQRANTSPPPPNSLVYRADARGHVVIDGYANGSPIRFVLDTGATLVSLTLSDAKAAGLANSDIVFKERANTANGVVQIAPVTLRELRIGQFSAYDVQAAVVQNLSVSLLGHSFLKRLDSYEMRDGVLTLNWR